MSDRAVEWTDTALSWGTSFAHLERHSAYTEEVPDPVDWAEKGATHLLRGKRIDIRTDRP